MHIIDKAIEKLHIIDLKKELFTVCFQFRFFGSQILKNLIDR